MIDQIIEGDCLEVMDRIPSKSIDMVLCDLPYGTTRNKWDCVIDLTQLWAIYTRIIKDNGAIVLTAQTPFDKVLGVSNLAWLRYEWIWRKDRGTGHLNANKAPLKNHENVLIFYKNMPVYNPQKTTGHKPANVSGQRKKLTTNYGYFEKTYSGKQTDRFPLSVIEFNTVNGMNSPIHPTQKPVKLFAYLIRTYSNPGDIVLDNCSGSGTTAEAAIINGRRFICIEKEHEYVEASKKRIRFL